MPLDNEQEQRLRTLFYKMHHELPYDIDSNALIGNTLIDYLRENPEQIEEFETIVLPYEPSFYPDWYTPEQD